MRMLICGMLAAVVVGGCQEAATPAAEPTAALAVSAQKPAKAPPSSGRRASICQTPRLTVAAEAGGPASFRPNGRDFVTFGTLFNQSVQASCESGVLGSGGLTAPGGAPVREITLYNAPSANVLSLYEVEGKMRLEYPFFEPGVSAVSLPDRAAIDEAIYCYAKGATADEQTQDGRCLPD